MLKAVTNLVNVSQITGVLPVVNGGTGVTTSTGTGNTVLSAAPTLSGNVSLSTGNLIISTAGKGIDFAATSGTGTSELFDDYEEGTWTPVVAFGGASVAITGTFLGKYTKIGRQVFGYCQLGFTNKGSSTGAMTVTGLPFTSIAAATYSCPAGFVSNLTLAVQFQSWINEVSSVITVQKMNLTATANVTDADIANNTRIDFSFSYLT